MPRAPFQVLVLPYRRTANTFEFAVFSRSDYECWQGVAGGGEDDETPLEAARREAYEEASISRQTGFLPLQATCSVPVHIFAESALWDRNTFVIPQHSFGVDCTGQQISLSHEHTEVQWLCYAEAYERLTYDSNRTALWELNQRVRGLGPRDTAA